MRFEFTDPAVRTGAVAATATTLAVAWCGENENGNALAPINAVSHCLWGERAAAAAGPSVKYTLTGLAVNGAAVMFWAGTQEVLLGRRIDRGGVANALLGGAAVAGLAYVTDYYLVPKRFTPGFEKRLSGRSLFTIYTVLGLSLGLARFYHRPRRPTPFHYRRRPL